MVIKAQVLAGGRGKGHFPGSGLKSGVHLISSPEEARSLASQMLNQNIVTKQTGPEGRVVSAVYVVERQWVRKEFYFAVLMDRAMGGPCIVASSQGGMDIEAVAASDPDAIIKLPVNINEGLQPKDARALAQQLGFSAKAITGAADMMQRLYKLFIEKDCTMVEINPMAENFRGEPLCMDAKLNFDDNADFRQPDVFKLRDTTQEDPREVQASEHKLNYIGLDGEIGCLVNGAGLAMATLDIIKLHGGSANNFLDVGGGATTEQVTQAFRLISSDKRVSTILVNIFGGIMRCDIIAQGIINAVQTLDLRIPLVVRLQGTRVQEAKELIQKSGMASRIFSVDDLDEAAKKAVQMSKIVKAAEMAGVKVKFEVWINLIKTWLSIFYYALLIRNRSVKCSTCAAANTCFSAQFTKKLPQDRYSNNEAWQAEAGTWNMTNIMIYVV